MTWISPTGGALAGCRIDTGIYRTKKGDSSAILVPGDGVILDDLSVHKSKAAEEAIRTTGVWLFFLPPYSPDLNPIEMAFAKLQAHLRDALAR